MKLATTNPNYPKTAGSAFNAASVQMNFRICVSMFSFPGIWQGRQDSNLHRAD